MSREIKFRAWNGDRMTNCGIQFNNTTGTLENKGNIALMQFTGLRDAYGVEIYEGDIVECDEHYYYEISWSEKYHSWDASECGGLVDLPAEIKVIGNIYEHPHLLDEAK